MLWIEMLDQISGIVRAVRRQNTHTAAKMRAGIEEEVELKALSPEWTNILARISGGSLDIAVIGMSFSMVAVLKRSLNIYDG
jgi:hypothetical protein